MNPLITILAVLFCLRASANDTLYFRLSNPWNTKKDNNGKYLRKCVMENNYCHVWDYNERNKLVTESFYADTNFTTKLFCHKYFDEQEGWLTQTRCYLNGRLDGYFVGYDKNGDTTDYDIYKEGEVIKSWRLHPAKDLVDEKTFTMVEFEAEFPGGTPGWLKYLGDNLRYPSSLVGKNIKGQVVVTFTVNAEGRVENVQIKKSLHPEFDKEAMRVIRNSPRWKPALQNNKKVSSYKTQPINF